MGNSAPVRRCSRCESAVDQTASFCERCGSRLSAGRFCTECGIPLEPSARFCSTCGVRVIDPRDQTNKAIDCLLAAAGLSLQCSDPQEVLEFCKCALRGDPKAADAAIAALLAMSCHAKLGNFHSAKQHLIAAREFYAAHVGLIESQRAKFLEDGCFFDDLSAVGCRDLEDNPWLYFFAADTGHHPRLPVGNEAEERNDSLRQWANFVDNSHERLLGVLAYLCISDDQHSRAAAYLERVLLIARKFGAIEPVRIELLWPLVISGNCYWANNQQEKAAAKWQRARSVEICLPVEPDSWETHALPWIERAKSKLALHSIPVPACEISRNAAEHLKQAVDHLFQAEQFEAADADLDELSTLIQRAGGRYTAPIERAAAELEAVERLDRFTWTQSPHKDSYHWYRYEEVKSLLFLKTALVQMANENLALAIASVKQAMELWPTLSIYALMGGLLATCGLVSDARTTYQVCIDRAEELGSVESTAHCQEILPEIGQALSALPS
jgi:tetratricopeptide (TPR) repeat protein